MSEQPNWEKAFGDQLFNEQDRDRIDRERENDVIRRGEFVLSDDAVRKVNYEHYTHWKTFANENVPSDVDYALMANSDRSVRIFTESNDNKDINDSTTIL